jgi:hypothetical protein
MSRRVKPVDPCQNCKTHAHCIEKDPPPQLHSGWECSYCGEIRWGGVLSAASVLRIGYEFSNGSVLCWRCHRKAITVDRMEQTLAARTANATSYPKLPYISGHMTTLWSDAKTLDRCCDECGNLVDANC